MKHLLAGFASISAILSAAWIVAVAAPEASATTEPAVVTLPLIRPSVCSGLIDRSPLFARFLRSNPETAALSPDGRKAAYVGSGIAELRRIASEYDELQETIVSADEQLETSLTDGLYGFDLGDERLTQGLSLTNGDLELLSDPDFQLTLKVPLQSRVAAVGAMIKATTALQNGLSDEAERVLQNAISEPSLINEVDPAARLGLIKLQMAVQTSRSESAGVLMAAEQYLALHNSSRRFSNSLRFGKVEALEAASSALEQIAVTVEAEANAGIEAGPTDNSQALLAKATRYSEEAIKLKRELEFYQFGALGLDNAIGAGTQNRNLSSPATAALAFGAIRDFVTVFARDALLDAPPLDSMQPRSLAERKAWLSNCIHTSGQALIAWDLPVAITAVEAAFELAGSGLIDDLTLEVRAQKKNGKWSDPETFVEEQSKAIDLGNPTPAVGATFGVGLLYISGNRQPIVDLLDSYTSRSGLNFAVELFDDQMKDLSSESKGDVLNIVGGIVAAKDLGTGLMLGSSDLGHQRVKRAASWIKTGLPKVERSIARLASFEFYDGAPDQIDQEEYNRVYNSIKHIGALTEFGLSGFFQASAYASGDTAGAMRFMLDSFDALERFGVDQNAVKHSKLELSKSQLGTESFTALSRSTFKELFKETAERSIQVLSNTTDGEYLIELGEIVTHQEISSWIDVLGSFLVGLPTEGASDFQTTAKFHAYAITAIRSRLDPDWKEELRAKSSELLLEIQGETARIDFDNGSWTDFRLDSGAIDSVISRAADHLVDTISMLYATENTEQATVILDALESVSAGISDVTGKVPRSILQLIPEYALEKATLVGVQYDRPKLVDDATAIWITRNDLGNPLRGDFTRDVRAGVLPARTAAFVAYSRLPESSVAKPEDFTALLQAIEIGNRTLPAVDLLARQRSTSLPEKAQDAYLRWRNYSLMLEDLDEERRNRALDAISLPNLAVDAFGRADRLALAERVRAAYAELQAFGPIVTSVDGKIDAPTVKAQMRPGELLVTGIVVPMSEGNKRRDKIILVSISASSIQAFSVRKDRGELKTELERYKNMLQFNLLGQPNEYSTPQANALASTIFGPLKEQMARSTSIVWVPPRDFSAVSVAGLPYSRDPGRIGYLGTKFALTTSPSLASFVEFRKKSSVSGQSRSPKSAIVGNVPFTGSYAGFAGGRVMSEADTRLSGGILSQLAKLDQSEPLFQRIKNTSPSTQLFEKQGASPERVRGLSAQNSKFGMVTFFTHGVGRNFSSRCGRPVSQALALYPERPDVCSTGLLSIGDVLSLQLKSQLVVLAACSTGASTSLNSDPMSGLTRAFLAGGADSVISSQTPLSETSAAYLVDRLHALILRDQVQPAEALRRVREEMMNDPILSRPAHWAPYELIGDGG